MSSQNPPTVSSLLSVIEELRGELQEYKGRLRLVEDRVRVLEEDRGSSDFDLVSEVVEPSSRAPASTTPTASDSGLASFRVAAAEEIGAWIRRGLRGEHRGLSGREKIPQANQYYVVVRDLLGEVHNPPLLFKAWSAAKPHCQHLGQCGDSIFVGLPSQAEVRIVLRSAQLRLPAALERP